MNSRRIELKTGNSVSNNAYITMMMVQKKMVTALFGVDRMEVCKQHAGKHVFLTEKLLNICCNKQRIMVGSKNNWQVLFITVIT